MQINVTMTLTLPQDGEKLAILAEMAGVKLAPTGVTLAAEPAKPPKKAKTEKAADVTPPPAPPAAAAPVPAVMDEKQSEERLKVVGEAFVQRFSKQDDAVGEVKKLIESKFKVARLRDLQHPQRVELIATLEARIKEIDSKQTQAAAPAATGLGL